MKFAIHPLNYPVCCFNFRRELPVDLAQGNLKALSLQGLGQVLHYNSSHLYTIYADILT